KTYVPLDPSYPAERLLRILQDAETSTILTNRRNLGLARAIGPDELRIVNGDDIDAAARASEIDLSNSPDAIAYILHTSGSTGQPKGIMQNHRNVLHFVRVYTNNLHLKDDDKLTLFSSCSHDAAVVDIFSALLNGATLYPKDIKTDGLAGLANWLDREEIT